MVMLGTADSPLRVAIIGAGPSGFYAAGHLLKNKHHPDLVAEVDLYDKLPTPFGLVRAGVAPDHPKIKAVTRVYDKTAAHPNFRFYGGVEIGKHITRDELHDRPPDRPPARDRRRRPARQRPRHRFRGLVQRPSRCPRPRIRPQLPARS